MSDYVADTMAIVLFLEKRKLPAQVKEIFAKALVNTVEIKFSAISLMEIAYLSEKGRIDISLEDVLKFVSEHNNFGISELTAVIVQRAFQIKDIPELHDRLITATASINNAKLITNDPLITASKSIDVIWAQ